MAGGHQGGGCPPRSPAAGVHAVSSRRADAGGNQRGDPHEPGHRAGALVQGVTEVTRRVGRATMSRRDSSEQERIALEESLERYRAAAFAEADAVFDDKALEQQ